VETVQTLAALAGAEMAVVVNPNNPDGQSHHADTLRALATQVGLLVVDESFADPTPQQSLSSDPGGRVVVLRSFGKFYGLAGVRLGFALADPATIARLSDMAGPWAVSGPALTIGAQALADSDWAAQTTARLHQDAARLDSLAQAAGWPLVGGTPLFRTYATPDAAQAQTHLAQRQIWTRRFPYSATWLRLGLPPAQGWARVENALRKKTV
jgi:cobalamin biosynthetic protein CobC